MPAMKGSSESVQILESLLLDIAICTKTSCAGSYIALGSKFFPLREVPILKKDAIEENHCLFQLPPFDVRNFFSVLAMPLIGQMKRQLQR